jgi:hypothetical protein
MALNAIERLEVAVVVVFVEEFIENKIFHEFV